MFRHYAEAGFGPDLLPILPRDAHIGPTSNHPETLKKNRGKVPGKLGRGGWFGFARWQEHQTNEADLAKWERWRDGYGAGVGMQGRRFPAIDVDVDDDTLALELRDLALSVLGPAPCRTRGTARCLLVYAYTGLRRRRLAFRLADQADDAKAMAVELLGDGQQYIVEGIHPSGHPYVWNGSSSPAFLGADALTRVSSEAVDIFFDKARELVEARGGRISAAAPAGGGERSGVWQDGLRAPSFDAACQALRTIPNELDYDGWHRLMVAFYAATGGTAEAFEVFAEWSSSSPIDDADVTAEKWADLEGRSLSVGWHQLASDAAKHSGDAEFSAKLEFRPVAEQLGDPPKMPSFRRRGSGEIEGTANNLRLALECPVVLGISIAYDEFIGNAVVDIGGVQRPIQDEDYYSVRLRLEEIGFKTIAKDLLRDAVWWVAHRNRFDSAQAWLNGLAWDGVPRVERFFTSCFDVPDTAYARACGKYVWTAHAGRVLEPGCIAAMAPILVGPQGAGKSRAVAAIAPSRDFHTEFNLKDENVEQARKMRGILVGELPELTGLKTRAREEIKAWLTQVYEHWRPAYKEMSVRYARRMLLWGTSNEDEILADPTGERRWLPLTVGEIDVSRIEAERDQLWAEGADIWRREGIAFANAESLAKAEHGRFRVADAWEEPIAAWLHREDVDGSTPFASGTVTVNQVLKHAIGLSTATLHKSQQMRAAEVLKACGMVGTQKRVGGVSMKVWEPTRGSASA